MNNESKGFISESEKDGFISILTDNLSALRTQADISQDDLSNLIGVSRQTYSSIERRTRKMSWSTYLSLIFFFDHNQKTHKMLRALSLFPKELVTRFNDGVDYSSFEVSSVLGDEVENLLECLDEQAKHSIATVAMIEYARCANISGEEVVKAFDGVDFFSPAVTSKDVAAAKALKKLKKSRANEE